MSLAHPIAALRTRLRRGGGQPMLVWHEQASGARIELSGESLWNYVCKAANLLWDEFETGPGDAVAVRLPAHWQSAAWVIAAWALGAHVIDRGDAAVVVARDSAAAELTRGVVTALDPWAGPSRLMLPPSLLDAGRELRMQPDAPAWDVVALDSADVAAVIGGASLSFAGLASEHPGDGACCGVEAGEARALTDDAAALDAVARVCIDGCLIIADGDADFVRRVGAAEGVSHWH